MFEIVVGAVKLKVLCLEYEEVTEKRHFLLVDKCIAAQKPLLPDRAAVTLFPSWKGAPVCVDVGPPHGTGEDE